MNIFSIPDKKINNNAFMVFVLSIIWTAVTSIIVTLGLFFLPNIWYRWVIFLGVSIFIGVFNIIVCNLGYVKFASWSLTIMLWLYITIPCYSAGGIFAPGILSQMSVILTAGFLLGWRGGLAIGILSMAVDLWFVYLEMYGLLPYPSVVHTPLTRWIGAVIPFGTILALQYYATNHLKSGLLEMHKEIEKRKETENIKDQIVYTLGERVKELKLLYEICKMMQNDEENHDKLLEDIVKKLPNGWQYPELASASITISGKQFFSENYKSSAISQYSELSSIKGTKIKIEVSYSQTTPIVDEGPFLKEERNLINMIAELLTMDLDRRERRSELKDYKYAIDLAAIVSISDVDGVFTFVNDNFCKASKYNKEELIGKNFAILNSGQHSEEFYNDLSISMKNGKPYRKEFCNKAKDGSLYWVDATIVPFLDENGNIFQYLSINYDITEKKEAEEKIRLNEKLLKKITSQVPGNTYMFEIEEDGFTQVSFMNRGTDNYNHKHSLEEVYKKSELLRDVIYEDDKVKFNDMMKAAFVSHNPISFQYRVLIDGNIRWRWMQAIPEIENDGKVIWYGATSDISPLVEYIASMEQILYDIGHVIRKPVSNMIGITQLIGSNDFNDLDLKDLSSKLHQVSVEMDKFIHELNDAYNDKRMNTKFNIDVSYLLDKRSSLFS